MYAFVKIARNATSFDSVVPILSVVIDNQKVGKLVAKSEILLPITPGYHIIYVQQRNLKSDVLKLHVQPSDIVHLECSASMPLIQNQLKLSFTQEPQTAIAAEYSYINVMREKSRFWNNVSLNVIIDNKYSNAVEDGQSVLLAVSPGTHNMYLSGGGSTNNIAGLRSDILQIYTVTNDVLDVVCSIKRNISVFQGPAGISLQMKNGDNKGSSGSKNEAQVGIDTVVSDEADLRSVESSIVNVPDGIKISVKRSRTFVHTINIDWNQATEGKLDIGWQGIVGASLRAEIGRRFASHNSDSVTIEHDVTLDGDVSNRFEIVWIDTWRKGYVEITGHTDHETTKVPFEFRESTQLTVKPLD